MTDSDRKGADAKKCDCTDLGSDAGAPEPPPSTATYTEKADGRNRSRLLCETERKENRVITQESLCLSSNHGRSEPRVRCCPNCGELVNERIPIEPCSEQSHARKRMDVGRLCPDCGQKL